MKLFLLNAAALLAAPLFTLAQDLTANEFPLTGDTVVVVNGDSSAFTIPSFGTGQTWDFTTVAWGTTKANILYLEPSKTTNGSKFTGSNIAEQTSGAGGSKTTTYYTRNSNSLTIVGTETGAGAFMQTIPYSNTEKLHDYPFASGGSNTDTYAAQVAGQFGSTSYRNGTVNVYFRGSGTLKTANKTYTDAILVEIATEQFDSTVSGFGTLASDFTERRFQWWVSGTRGWVMETNTRTSNGFGGTTTQRTLRTRFVAGSNATVANVSGQTKLTVAVNAASKEAYISIETLQEQPLLLLDMAGRICHKAATSPGLQQVTLPISGLAAGCYVVQVGSACALLLIP